MRGSGGVRRRSRLGVLIAAAAIAVSICAAAPTAARPARPAQTTTTAITGTVTDPSGKPLSGVTVQLSVGPVVDFDSTTTAANGTYTFTNFPIGFGNFYVGFTLAGYAPQWWNNKPSLAAADPVPVTSGQTTTGIDAVLQPAPNTGAISGHVTASAGGPAFEASVVATNTSTGESVTVQNDNTTGAYTFAALDPGTYTVGFTDSGYVPQWWNNKSSAATADPITVTAGQVVTGIDAALASTGCGCGFIQGTVTNASGAPVAGASVSVYPSGGGGAIWTATTSSDGTYTANISPAPGTYQVQFSAPNYTVQWYDNQSSQATATPITVGNGQTITGIDAQLQVAPSNSATLSGSVSNFSAGGPVVGATVVVHNYFGFDVTQTTTDSSGNWSVSNLAAGVYRLEVQPPAGSNLSSWWYNNEVDLAHSNPIALANGQAITGIETLLASGVAVSGTVTDAAGPVAGARVSLFSGNAAVGLATVTAADGTYSFSGISPGLSYRVLFDPPPGSADAGQWYNASPTENGASQVQYFGTPVAGIDAQLSPAARGSISGTVADHGGNSISGATVEAVAADGRTTTTATTAADGSYSIGGLDVGIYTVWFVPPTGSSYRSSFWNNNIGKVVPLTVDQGSNVTGINGSLSQNGSVSGTVTGPSGPVAGATVLVTNYYGFGEASATTAADGSYTVTGLGPGSSRVEFTASGYVTQWWNNQPDQAHSNTLNVPNNGTATANATLAPSG